MKKEEVGIGCIVMLIIGLIVTIPCSGINGCKADYKVSSRSGKLVQFGEGGLFTITGEGTLHTNELSLGGEGNAWRFSCRDPDLSKQLSALVGKNVKLSYNQWWRQPWYQDTPFTVTAVEEQY